MRIEIRTTQDGSNTLFVPELGEHYHSHFGALQESMHIFIESALKQIDKERINILEFGLGTGLNALLSCNYAIENKIEIHYTSIEKYPISKEELLLLEYQKEQENTCFEDIHNAKWGTLAQINDFFFINKIESDFRNIKLEDNVYDVVYFDAFAPDVQPHLWTDKIFSNIYNSMRVGGVFTTYTVKGNVRRALKNQGFKVEKIPGPPGKREITRAWKI